MSPSSWQRTSRRPVLVDDGWQLAARRRQPAGDRRAEQPARRVGLGDVARRRRGQQVPAACFSMIASAASRARVSATRPGDTPDRRATRRTSMASAACSSPSPIAAQMAWMTWSRSRAERLRLEVRRGIGGQWRRAVLVPRPDELGGGVASCEADAALDLLELGELTGIDGAGEAVQQAEPVGAGDGVDRDLGVTAEPVAGGRVEGDVEDEGDARRRREAVGGPAEDGGWPSAVAPTRPAQHRRAQDGLDGVDPGRRRRRVARARGRLEAENAPGGEHADVAEDRRPIAEELACRSGTGGSSGAACG